MDDEAGVPAVEVLVRSHRGLQLLQQSAVGTFSFGVHGGAHVVQHAHDAGRVLQRRMEEELFYDKQSPLETDLT